MRTTTKREVLLIVRVDVSEVVKKKGGKQQGEHLPIRNGCEATVLGKTEQHLRRTSPCADAWQKRYML